MVLDCNYEFGTAVGKFLAISSDIKGEEKNRLIAQLITSLVASPGSPYLQRGGNNWKRLREFPTNTNEHVNEGEICVFVASWIRAFV